MSLGARVERAVRFVVHNWPLKLAAIALATLLYAGLVASQDSSVFPGPVPVTAINKPPGTVVTNDLRDLDQIRYIAPLEVGRLLADDFEATVDLSNVNPDGQPVSVRVAVTPVDPRVTVLDFQPRSIQVVLDELTTKQVPVDVQREAAPDGVDVGEVTYEPTEVTVTGPGAAVSRVVEARVVATLDPEGIDFDREVEARPVDDNGEVVVGVELDPRTVHVSIPLFTNRESRTLPVNPVVTGTPAQGFRIASVAADPLVVSVEGDADQLAALLSADTAPVSVSGATRDVSVEVPLALPAGVVAVDADTVRVSVRIEALTETRTYSAGIRLDGREPGLEYEPVGVAGAADAVRAGGRPRPPGHRADRGRRQRRGPGARHARRPGGPIVALDPDPRRGVARHGDRHDRRTADAGAGLGRAERRFRWRLAIAGSLIRTNRSITRGPR